VKPEELAALSERAAGVIARGGGLKALAQMLADELRGAVLVEDDQWRHLAFADSRGAKAAAGRGVPTSFATFYRKPKAADGHVSRAAVSESLHALCAPMPGGFTGNGEPAGYVTLFVRAKPAAHAAVALRIVASAASVECLRRGAGGAHAKREFWERFLAGAFSDATALRDDAAAAGVSLAHAYVAGIFEVEGATVPDARDAIAAAIASADGVCPPALAGQSVLALFPVRSQADVARARQAATNAARDLSTAGAARSVTCGLGAHHPELLETPVSLAQARQALALGRRLFGRGSVTVFSDLGVYALLDAGASRDAFARFADTLIDPLTLHDKKHKTELLKTLRLYFDVGENVKEAAERLSVHRHTIFYRLNQISQILKVDLRSPRDQLGLRAALAIRQMRSESES